MTNKDNDIKLLNVALELEHFAVAAYYAAINSGLLSEEVIKVAKAFESHHGHHAGRIRELILEMNGEPVKPAHHEEYMKKMPLDKLTDQKSIIHYALTLEKKAAVAHLNLVKALEDRKLSEVAASISGDEAMHWATLRQALGLFPVHVSFIPLSEDLAED